MGQQHINIGTGPNSGDGDTVRGAFSKTEDNVTELFGKTNSSAFINDGSNTEDNKTYLEADITTATNGQTPVWNGSEFILKAFEDIHIIDVTYSELTTLIASNGLIKGQVYLLTDYMTTYTQPVTLASKSSGIVEPLYLTATDVNKLSNIAYSQLYPQDIVYYEVTGDIGFAIGTEGFTKGKIYRRIDTIRHNDIGTDWRHVKYDREGVDKLLFTNGYYNTISHQFLMNTVFEQFVNNNTITSYPFNDNTITGIFSGNTIKESFQSNTINGNFNYNNINKDFKSNTINQDVEDNRFTVATLPTGISIGQEFIVTDALNPTYLGTLTGGGTVVCPVFYNGTTWISH